ncbi:MAG: 3-isopropylmalate dehydratase small subunit, partial [Haliea sp.]
DIFYNNSFKNGILPVVLPAEQVEELFAALYAEQGYRLKVDLGRQQVETPSGEVMRFEVDAARKHCLLQGLDDIGVTLESAGAIRSFEQRWRQSSPWLFDAIGREQR